MPAQDRLRFEDHDDLIETLAGTRFRTLEFVRQRSQYHSLRIGYAWRGLHLALQNTHLLA
jgi:hypothetical protein